MPRYPSQVSYSFGPGGITPAVKAIIIANVAMFIATVFAPEMMVPLALTPQDVVTRGAIWQPVTYLFLHAGVFHILFNMLALWMFGVDLERTWGTTFFVKYYAITGIGAGLVTVAVSLLPFQFALPMYASPTVGASGAVYGLLLAYGLYFPDRPIYLYFIFMIPARWFVIIVGAIAFISSFSGSGSNVAHFAHLGGLVIGYLYLRGRRLARFNLIAELKYRYIKWKIARMRRRFDVHPGGRSDDWDRRIH